MNAVNWVLVVLTVASMAVSTSSAAAAARGLYGVLTSETDLSGEVVHIDVTSGRVTVIGRTPQGLWREGASLAIDAAANVSFFGVGNGGVFGMSLATGDPRYHVVLPEGRSLNLEAVDVNFGSDLLCTASSFGSGSVFRVSLRGTDIKEIVKFKPHAKLPTRSVFDPNTNMQYLLAQDLMLINLSSGKIESITRTPQQVAWNAFKLDAPSNALVGIGSDPNTKVHSLVKFDLARKTWYAYRALNVRPISGMFAFDASTRIGYSLVNARGADTAWDLVGASFNTGEVVSTVRLQIASNSFLSSIEFVN